MLIIGKRGFSLLDLCISLLVTIPALLASIQFYQVIMGGQQRINELQAISQIEQELTSNLLESLANFFKTTNCTKNTNSPPLFLNAARETSFNGELLLLDSQGWARLYNLYPNINLSLLSQVIERCQNVHTLYENGTSTNPIPEVTNFSPERGFYFCMHLSFRSIEGVSGKKSLAFMQPVIGEFLYYKRDITNNKLLRCNEYSSSNPGIEKRSLEFLRYTLHWSTNSSATGKVRHVSGVLALGE